MAPKVSLTFDKLKYTVQTSLSGKPAGAIDKIKKATAPKVLLQDIKGEVTTGHVLAILGPSGAGKTTLLNMLTLAKKGGAPSGHIQVNGQPITLSLYNSICAYVEQFDTLWAVLTVHDHLYYAMTLHRPDLDAASREEAIDNLIKEVGLDDCRNTRAGNQFVRGLSGGNKRRLSIAVALTKHPSLLFLDEPTSGVDSASAVYIMSFLKDIAQKANIAIVCTIHQPPASVFAGFDNVMILSMGRVAYFGNASSMADYLEAIGKPSPADINLAEYVLDLVNTDFTSVDGVREILDKWMQRDGQPYGVEASLQNDENGSISTPISSNSTLRASFLTQLIMLTKRSIVVAAREPLSYLLRIGANFGSCLFFGIIYLKTRDHAQSQATARTFFVMFCVGIPMQFIVVSTYLYYHQFLSLKKEVKDGMYHPIAGAISSWIFQLPMMFVLSVSSLIPMFLVGNLGWSGFPMAMLVYASALWSFEGMAQMLAIAPNVVIALFNFINIYFAAFLFCGMFVDPKDVIWPVRIFCYILPLGWTLQSYMYAVFDAMPDQPGTFECIPGDVTAVGSVCGAQGFYCYSPDDPIGAVCFGRTGKQILETLSMQFTIFAHDSINCPSCYARNIAIILAFGTVCRFSYMVMAYVATTLLDGQLPSDPTPGSPEGIKEFAVNVTPDESQHGTEDSQPTSPSAKIAASLTSDAVTQKTVFNFSSIGYDIKPKSVFGRVTGPAKSVLANASAEINAGEVLAVIGPSGAGKTILLDTLTFAKGPGKPTGKISLNGIPMTRKMYIDHCMYVPREDNLWPTMTPRQHLEFAFKQFKPEMTLSGRDAAIDDLLSATGMKSCQHTQAGGLLFQGLSGGQRRRLSLAIAIVKEPRVIILDEPTSGLDSAAAAAIVSLLKSIATRCNIALVVTIHQPSAAVFAAFQKLLVLSEGRVAYCGARNDVSAYFASIAKPLNKDANPAEAVVDLVSKDMTSKENVRSVLDLWETKGEAIMGITDTTTGTPIDGKTTIKFGLCASTLHLFYRQMRLALVDPLQFLVRLIVAPFITCFFGLIYKETANANQVQVPFRLFFLWWMLAVPPFLCIITIVGGTFDMRSVVQEIKAGMYRPISYAISTSMVQIPMLLLLSLLVTPLAFLIGGWPWDNFVTSVLLIGVNLWVYENLGQLLTVIFKNPVIGMLAFLMFWTASIVFCGLVFRGKDVIWPFRLMYYILPLRWVFNGVGWDIYTPESFSGASLCVPGTNYTSNTLSNLACTQTGFYCDDASSSFGCWGSTGSQVLTTLHLTYESLDASDDRVMDFAIMIGMSLTLKACFALTLWRAVEASDSPN